MKCISCGFYNLPGTPACGRCGQSLAGGAIAGSQPENLLPPRAQDRDLRQSIRARNYRGEKWLTRQVAAVVAALYEQREFTAQSIPFTNLPMPRVPTMGELPALLRSWMMISLAFMPGLPQLIGKRTRMGAALAGGTALLIALAALTIHNQWSDTLFGVLLLVVLFSIWETAESCFSRDSVNPDGTGGWSLRLFLLSFAVFFGAIASVGFLFNTTWQLATLPYNNVTGLEAEDQVIVRTHGHITLKRGDVIIADERDDGPGYLTGIEAVIAVPGDQVENSDRGILVNAKPVALPAPHYIDRYGPIGVARRFQTTVPAGHFGTWTTRDGFHIRVFDTNAFDGSPRVTWSTLVVGKIVGVYEPPEHRRLLR